MVEIRARRGRLYEGGNERLRYRIEVPYIESCEALNSMYERIGQECELFCNQSLFESLRAKKRLYRYELTFSVANDDGEVISLVFCAKLMGEKCISERFFAMTLSAAEQRMIDPSILLKRFGRKKRKDKFSGTPFLREGSIAYITEDGRIVFER